VDYKYFITTGAPFEKVTDLPHSIFSGDWCYIKERKWSEIKNSQTIKYPFKNHEEIERAHQRIIPAYHHFIQLFTTLFKDHRHIDRNTLYFEKLLGSWLLYFLNNCYEKYRILEITQETYPGLKVKVVKDSHPPCKDYLEYGMLSQESDTFNFYQYSKLINSFPGFKKEEIALPPIQQIKIGNNLVKTHFNKIIRRFCYQSLHFLSFNQKPKTLIVDPYYENIPSRSIQILIKSKGQILHDLDYLRSYCPLNTSIDVSSRMNAAQDIENSNHSDPFINTTAKLIMESLPISYWENIQKLTLKAKQWRNKNKDIKQVFTCNAHMYNTFFSTICAEHPDIQLAISQHGGSYGYAKVFNAEWYEKRIAHHYFTWGWGNKVLPHPKLLKKKVRKTTKILLTFPSPGYFGSFLDNFYSSSNVLTSYQQTKYFLNSLPSEILENIFIRERPHSFVRKFQDHQPDLEPNFSKSLMESQLHITNHLSTPFLESMSANIPTIAFYDNEVQTLREEAQFDFQQLEDAKILFKSPEDAVEHLKNIQNNLKSWWSSENTQKARYNFCQKYARTTKNWMDVFTNSLSKL